MPLDQLSTLHNAWKTPSPQMGLNGSGGVDAMFLPGAVPGTLEDLEESILREATAAGWSAQRS